MRARTVLLAEDETDLLLFPPLRAAWGLKAKPLSVPISGRNARRVVFGAIDLRKGDLWWLTQAHQTADDFQDFLEYLRDCYRKRHVALLLDEDSSHTDEETEGLAEELSIELIWLPKRAPKLNPMDHLWGQGKNDISANRQYTTIDEQVERFHLYLARLSSEDAIRLAGVLSPTFWLKSVL
ncbi:MAG: transposase [Thermoguttaceae bacterium]